MQATVRVLKKVYICIWNKSAAPFVGVIDPLNLSSLFFGELASSLSWVRPMGPPPSIWVMRRITDRRYVDHRSFVIVLIGKKGKWRHRSCNQYRATQKKFLVLLEDLHNTPWILVSPIRKCLNTSNVIYLLKWDERKAFGQVKTDSSIKHAFYSLTWLYDTWSV